MIIEIAEQTNSTSLLDIFGGHLTKIVNKEINKSVIQFISSTINYINKNANLQDKDIQKLLSIMNKASNNLL